MQNSTKLRNKNKLENIRKIYVTPDLTPREQQQNKVLKAELAEKNKDGNKYCIKMARLCREEIDFSLHIFLISSSVFELLFDKCTEYL